MKGKPPISRGGPSTEVEGPERSNLDAITNTLAHRIKEAASQQRVRAPEKR